MSKEPDEKKIRIEGITKDGKQFRPSDWAHRMSDRLATYNDHRIKYSPLLQPSENSDGYKCVLIDPELKKSNPKLYDSILDFARKNNLKICDED